MFGKALGKYGSQSLGEVLAVSLGEVRQPQSSAQWRAASTAGALLAGYFPHLRAAFRFPPHLALPAATQQNAQIASLLSVQDPPHSDVAAGKAHKTNDGTDDMDTVRTSVVATLMAREYGPRMHRLEQKCLTLIASNNQLTADAEIAQARSEKTRELNRRLCREVNEARSERTVAFESMEQLKQQVKRAQEEVEQVRSESATQREALQVSQQELSTTRGLFAALQAATAQDCFHSKSASIGHECSPSNENGPAPSPLVVPLSNEPHIISMVPLSNEPHIVSRVTPESDPGDVIKDAKCSCGNSAWGCACHRVYSDRLMLAHREMAAMVSRGPPGLEMEAPPGLADPQQPCSKGRYRVIPRLRQR
jgi:hypothetical protein